MTYIILTKTQDEDGRRWGLSPSQVMLIVDNSGKKNIFNIDQPFKFEMPPPLIVINASCTGFSRRKDKCIKICNHLKNEIGNTDIRMWAHYGDREFQQQSTVWIEDESNALPYSEFKKTFEHAPMPYSHTAAKQPWEIGIKTLSIEIKKNVSIDIDCWFKKLDRVWEKVKNSFSEEACKKGVETVHTRDFAKKYFPLYIFYDGLKFAATLGDQDEGAQQKKAILDLFRTEFSLLPDIDFSKLSIPKRDIETLARLSTTKEPTIDTATSFCSVYRKLVKDAFSDAQEDQKKGSSKSAGDEES